ncbi:MAG: sugar ABC transporter ATP-binding protein [Fimbriimonadales bacterium]
MEYALEMIGIGKRFPGTFAVDGVDLRVRPGEAHALLGENGAGKSTLMKVLAGDFADYSGEIRIGGKPVAIHSPAEAKAHGIAMIHQELSLSLPQSIAENILAGRLPTRAGVFVDQKAMVRQAKECMGRLGLGLDPLTPVERLSQNEAQLIEIAKALGSNPNILVMDEPTSALTRDDVEILFAIIRRLKQQGLAIVYISHHLSEVFQIGDRATVIRDGKLVGVRELDESSPEELVKMMVGRDLATARSIAGTSLSTEAQGPHREHGEGGETESGLGDTGSSLPGPPFKGREQVSGGEKDAGLGGIRSSHPSPSFKGRENETLAVKGLSRTGFFKDVAFSLKAGEIVGLCGLAGAGRTELARSLCGIDPLDEGTLALAGKPVRIRSQSQALDCGIAYLTEDRKQQGLALRLSLRENALSALIPRMGPGPFYSANNRAETLTNLVQGLQITPPNPRQLVRNLSGGNQQKVLLAKWLATEPKVMILDEPTRGVDVGAKALIHDAILKLAAEGASILLISSDLPELIQLSSRVLIMRKGRLIAELDTETATEESLLLAANGVPSSELGRSEGPKGDSEEQRPGKE